MSGLPFTLAASVGDGIVERADLIVPAADSEDIGRWAEGDLRDGVRRRLDKFWVGDDGRRKGGHGVGMTFGCSRVGGMGWAGRKGIYWDEIKRELSTRCGADRNWTVWCGGCGLVTMKMMIWMEGWPEEWC